MYKIAFCNVLLQEGIGLSAGKWARGVYKLLEEYDVLPSYCSKKDVKTIFNLVIYAEVNMLFCYLKF